MKYVFNERVGEGFIVLEPGDLKRLAPLYEKDWFYSHGILGVEESYAAQSALHILGINVIETYVSKMSLVDPIKLHAQLNSIKKDCSKRTSSLRDYMIQAFGPFFYSKKADGKLDRLEEADSDKIIDLFNSKDYESLQHISMDLCGCFFK